MNIKTHKNIVLSISIRLGTALILLAGLLGGAPAMPVRAATIIVVTDNTDHDSGSLRAAVAAADSGDIINFDSGLSGATIALTSGEIPISKNLTIDGSDLTSPITVSGENTGRVFVVDSSVTAVLNNLTITKGSIGDGSGSAYGGGIYNGGDLTVKNSTVSGSHADFGGGIYNAGALTVTNSTISGNSSVYEGGGIVNYGALTIVNSTFYANSGRGGGGLFTISATVINSTFSGNSASSNGGAIYIGSILYLTNSILANNSAPEGGDCYGMAGSTVGDHNIVRSDYYGSCGATGADPKLITPPADNGGPTLTMALDPTSPAVNAGNDSVCAGTSVNGEDQRGVKRPLGAHCDIGAFELELPSATTEAATGVSSTEATFNATVNANGFDTSVSFNYGLDTTYGSSVPVTPITVTGDTDTPVSQLASGLLPGRVYHFRVSATNANGTSKGEDATFSTDCLAGATVTSTDDDGEGTLRWAIAGVCAGDTITFDNTLAGGIIALDSTLSIEKDLTIDGSGLTSPVTISGDTTGDGTGDVRVFHVNSTFTATLKGLTITKGSDSSSGGDILNDGTLTVANSTISVGNAPAGGGIYNTSGSTLTVTNTTFTGNSANWGGGLQNDGTATVANSTFSDNSVVYSGGGLYNTNLLTLTNNTFFSNSASPSEGGGIFQTSAGTLNLSNTILAGSTGGDCVSYGSISTNTHNLIQDGSCADSSNLSGDPGLDPASLADNGGPTQTIALVTGSKAIDAGDNDTCAAAPVLNRDQRGVSRLKGPHCDIGAFESAIPVVTTNAATGMNGTTATLNGTVNALDDSTTTFFEYGETTAYGTTVDAVPHTLTGSLDTPVSAAISGLTLGTVYHFRAMATNSAGTNYGSDMNFKACLSTISVTDDGNDGPGTLRQALADLCPGGTITFATALAGQTITLSSVLQLAQDLTIDGSGLSPQITISGDDTVRVFQVDSGVTADLKVLTITKGNSIVGGAIYNAGTLNLTASTVSDSSTTTTGSGGGIYNDGTLTVMNSTISGNDAGYGGGIRNFGTLTVTKSTISGNGATYVGGGIYTEGTLTLTNSTLSGNTSYDGGAITNAGTLTILNSTIAGNTVTGGGGGIETWAGSVSISNTIVAGNSGDASWGPDCYTPSATINSYGYNLIGTLTACTITDAALSGTNIIGSDPKLGTFDNHGGPTWTMALLPDSPALDVIPVPGCNGAPSIDQRGAGRPLGTGCDIGAYEATYPYAKTEVFTDITATSVTLNSTVNARSFTTSVTFEYGTDTGYGTTVSASPSTATGNADTAVSKALSGLMPGTTYHYRVAATNDGGTTVINGDDVSFFTPCGPAILVTSKNDHGAGTLRQAILSLCPGGTISFASSLAGQTIALDSTLTVDRDLTIDATGLSSHVIVSGQDTVQVFIVNSGVTASLKGLTITEGYADNYGAGINNSGSLTLTHSTISDNNAVDSGGGIQNNSSGTLTITDSTLSGNNATYYAFGGGIDNSGMLTVKNSTFSGNNAYMGAGIDNESGAIVVIANSTFSGNAANNSGGGYGGGMRNDSLAIVTNSTFAGNSATLGGGIWNKGTLSYANTILANATGGVDCWNADGLGGVIGMDTNNLVMSGYNCGTPSVTDDPSLGSLRDNGGPTWTMALLPGSPAIGAGDTDTCTNAPVSGKDQRGTTRPQCDIGAFAYEAPIVTTEAASSLGSTSATLNGTVNPMGYDMTVTFEYGTDLTYGTIVAATPNTVSGRTATSVSAVISGLDPSTTYHYRVVATVEGAAAYGDDKTFDTVANATPTGISLSPNHVAENQPYDTLVGTFSTTDPDSGDTFTYSFCDGPDDGYFYISDDQLFTDDEFDKEERGVYNICVTSTDNGGASHDESLSVYIDNVNEEPEDLWFSSRSVAENSPIDTVVGTFSTWDPDEGDTFTYSLVTTCTNGGADNGSFNTSGDTLRTSAVLDYETRIFYNICVRTTDSGGLYYDLDFTIGVRNVDDTPTNLDLTFGTGGKVTTSLKTPLHGKVTTDFGENSNGYAVAIQPDGKIVVAGYAYNYDTDNDDFALARYNSDGSLDTTFGPYHDGTVLTDFGNYAYGYAVALQSDGKIVMVGYLYGSYNKFALARYNSNGSLDTTFGTNGKATADFGDDAEGYAVAIQSDGSIVVAGAYYNDSIDQDEFALARFTSGGSLDTTFGTSGLVTSDFGDYAEGYAVAIQSSGKIVVAGYVDDSYEEFALARYTSTGSLDTTFGTDGVATADFGDYAEIYAIAIRSDDSLIAAGYAYDSGTDTDVFALAHFDSDGLLDTAFGVSGLATADFGVNAYGYGVKLQPDGKIVVAGYSHVGKYSNEFALARFTGGGSLDTTFDTDGMVTTDFGDESYGHAVAIQSDGKIIVAGQAYNSYTSNDDFALARYNSDGSPDDSFGIVINDAEIHSVAIQPDGRIVAAGVSYNYSDQDFVLARYNSPGSLDTTFGTDGTATLDFAGDNDEVYAIAVQPDGKIIVAGTAYTGSTNYYEFALARYTSAGLLDTTFGTGGMVTTDFGTYWDTIQAIVLQPDGKIVAVGYTSYAFALARYTSDGSLDTTFGTSGKVTTGIGAYASGYAVALRTDSRIVVAGYSYDSSASANVFALAQYTANGTLDPTFGASGIVTTFFNGSDVGKAVALQPDGKIVLAGSSYNSGKNEFALARYTSDGSLDTSFDTDGMVTTGFVGTLNDAESILIQPGGHILVTGTANSYEVRSANFALVRYDSNGSLDTSFATGGKAYTNFGSEDAEAYAAALQPDNKVVLAGYSYNNGNNAGDLALARFEAFEPPTVATDPASGVTSTGATLNGTVMANNFSTTVTFEYGLTTAYGTTVTADQSPVTGMANTAVSKAVTGLTPDTTYHFRVVGANSQGNPHGDDMTFKTLPTYALSVSKTGNGSGTVTSNPAGIDCGATCSASFNSGVSVMLTATAATASTFIGWTGSGCTGTGTCTVTMDAAKSVTANFTQGYRLSVSKTGTGSGTVTSFPAGINCGSTCSASFDYNTSVTLTAIAAIGSTFTGWSGAGCTGTGTCTVTLDAARSVTADFNKPDVYFIYIPLYILHP